MKKKSLLTFAAAVLLSGCAGQTTDPRQGGLFSYDPKAYDQRLADRENRLAELDHDNAVQSKKNRQLKYEKRKL